MYDNCMITVNVSLPDKLKDQAQDLVLAGYYASLSDVIRDSLRATVHRNKYDLLADQAERDLLENKGVVFKSKEEVRRYFDSI